MGRKLFTKPIAANPARIARNVRARRLLKMGVTDPPSKRALVKYSIYDQGYLSRIV